MEKSQIMREVLGNFVVEKLDGMVLPFWAKTIKKEINGKREKLDTRDTLERHLLIVQFVLSTKDPSLISEVIELEKRRGVIKLQNKLAEILRVGHYKYDDGENVWETWIDTNTIIFIKDGTNIRG